jgi:hypothetical protein
MLLSNAMKRATRDVARNLKVAAAPRSAQRRQQGKPKDWGANTGMRRS